MDGFNGGRRGLVDATLQIHRVHAGGNRLETLGQDGLSQHGRSGGAITGDVGGLGSDFLDHLRTHVLELVSQFDLLGDGHTVLGHGRSAETLFQNHIAPLRTQRHLDGLGKNIHTANHAATGIITEFNVFCCHLLVTFGCSL